MWPHSLVIGVGEVAVCVGTDDAGLAAHLQPWAVDEPAGLVDYALTLHPPERPRGEPRELPSLRHGTDVLARTQDTDLLRDGLLRTLAALAPSPAGTVRLSGVPLLRDGAVHLAPPELAAVLPSRWLAQHGFTPVWVQSVAVNPATLQVHIAAPLGSDDQPLVAPLHDWWITVHDPTVELTFAQWLTHAAPRLGPVADAAAGTAAMEVLMELLHRLPALPVSAARGDLQAALIGGPSTFRRQAR